MKDTSANLKRRVIHDGSDDEGLLDHLLDIGGGGGDTSPNVKSGHANVVDSKIVKKRKVDPVYSVSDSTLDSVQQQIDHSSTAIQDNYLLQTPSKKNAFLDRFQTFTPRKSRFSVVSSSRKSTTKKQTTELKFQTQNEFVPESPFNIKIKSNKIIPFKIFSSTTTTTTTTTTKPTTSTTTQEQQDDDNNDDDIKKDLFKDEIKLHSSSGSTNGTAAEEEEEDLPLTQTNISVDSSQNNSMDEDTIMFLKSEVSSLKVVEPSSNNNNNNSNSNQQQQQTSEYDIKQQLYYPRPETIQIEKTDSLSSSSIQLPIDFCLKSHIAFISNTLAFDWCSRAYFSNSLKSQSLANYMIESNCNTSNNNNNNVNNQSTTTTRDEKFLKCLYYHTFPSSEVLPWDTNKPVLKSETFKHQWMDNRWTQWMESLDSLYSNFKEGQIPYFYVLNHLDFSIFFLNNNGSNGNGDDNDRQPKVIINPSNRKLRDLLSDFNIEWQTPFLNIKQDKTDGVSGAVSSNDKLEFKGLNMVQKKIVDPSYYQTSLSSSLIEIHGVQEIDKLVMFIKKKFMWQNHSSLNIQDPDQQGGGQQSVLSKSEKSLLFTPSKSRSLITNSNESVKKQQLKEFQDEKDQENTATTSLMKDQYNSFILCRDVPILLTKQSFLGSSIKMNRIISCGSFTKSFQSSKSQLEKAFKVEFDGPLLPDTVYQLSNLLIQDYSDLQCKQSSITTNYGFNYNHQHQNNDHNGLLISKSSQMLDRNVIQKFEIINNKIHLTPIG
ncbi:hypothetical protein CYY_002723 [Polysphondylium violaceum]|uniref:Uncharacterized protein n=1 Tax=Polysphondylium violaceum TaxID=133409 RepID=A0A8J4PZQ3_9MYCE|nr:hypothetical protein CYY_002723 [Polysphondylium violaceum]